MVVNGLVCAFAQADVTSVVNDEVIRVYSTHNELFTAGHLSH